MPETIIKISFGIKPRVAKIFAEMLEAVAPSTFDDEARICFEILAEHLRDSLKDIGK